MSDQQSASERLAESWLSKADVAELKADAWEEGYTRACLDDKHGQHPGPNPYRVVAVDRPRPKCGHSPGHEAGTCEPTSGSFWGENPYDYAYAKRGGIQMGLSDLLRNYRDGDELPDGWPEEFAWLRQEHHRNLVALRKSVERVGITTPILLGSDGRVWDGHHRLCVAYDMGLEYVPVEFAGERP